MRRDNYIISLVNEDVIQHYVEIPLVGSFSIFTRAFNAAFMSILNWALFDANDLKPDVLRSRDEYVHLDSHSDTTLRVFESCCC
jgi:predicted ATP-grasp superfamily ATP-dependent carboligase